MNNSTLEDEKSLVLLPQSIFTFSLKSGAVYYFNKLRQHGTDDMVNGTTNTAIIESISNIISK